MRLSAILTSSLLLFIIHQLVSAWFLVDFFLARDSSTVYSIRRKHNTNSLNDGVITSYDRNKLIIKNVAKDLKTKHCLPQNDPAIEKVIFIIIDALGSKFIPSLENVHAKEQTMPYIESLLKKDKALGYIAKAATPTVTMPRIKALISGTIPSFVDILANLAKDVSHNFDKDDNILSSALSLDKSIVFYGDDTWLSLIPRESFLRYRETHSLFATDYTTVDTNVTEDAIPETLRNPIDWDYLVMHYLGLDHIGHTFGVDNNPKMYTKLIEMDDVVKQLHDNMSRHKHRSLIVVCGDHGMSPEGNHGGDGKDEINTAMIFIPVNCDLKSRPLVGDKSILQIDLATTLAYLTGLPTPKYSRGIPVEGLLRSLFNEHETGKKLVCASLETLVHLVNLIDADYDQTNNITSQTVALLNEHLISKDGLSTDELMIRKYYSLAKAIQNHLIGAIAAKSSPIGITIALLLSIVLTLINLRRSCIKLFMPLMLFNEKILCILVAVIPLLMQVSTDYIEMEHYFWPLYSLLVLLAFLGISVVGRKNHLQVKRDIDYARIGIFVISFAIHYAWNNIEHFQTDLGWIPLLVSIPVLCNFTRTNSELSKLAPKLATILFYSAGTIIFYTKILEDSTDQDAIFQVAAMQILSFMLLMSLTFINIWSLYATGEVDSSSLVQKLAISWMWFALLLSRSRNYPYLISNVLLEVCVNSIANSFQLGPMVRSLIYLQFSASSFYNQGNTNLFSSIDVKPAFYGQTNYNFLLAAPLVASATYSAQIYWYLKLFQRVQGHKEQNRMQIDGRLGGGVDIRRPELRSGVRDFIDMQNYLTLAFYMFVCVVLRNHLFVWSVLSPKLVYHWMGTMIVLRSTTAIITNLPSLMIYFFERDQKASSTTTRYRSAV